jgi:hypothetical protein
MQTVPQIVLESASPDADSRLRDFSERLAKAHQIHSVPAPKLDNFYIVKQIIRQIEEALPPRFAGHTADHRRTVRSASHARIGVLERLARASAELTGLSHNLFER